MPSSMAYKPASNSSKAIYETLNRSISIYLAFKTRIESLGSSLAEHLDVSHWGSITFLRESGYDNLPRLELGRGKETISEEKRRRLDYCGFACLAFPT